MSANWEPTSGNRPRRAAMWMLTTSRIETPSESAWRPSSWAAASPARVGRAEVRLEGVPIPLLEASPW